jgi:hypothetical protein
MQKPELQQILQGWQQHLSRPEPARVPQHKKQ